MSTLSEPDNPIVFQQILSFHEETLLASARSRSAHAHRELVLCEELRSVTQSVDQRDEDDSAHVKLDASYISPLPLYCATFGY